jgi:hypothetical protein
MFPVLDATESCRGGSQDHLSPPIAAPEWTQGNSGSSTSRGCSLPQAGGRESLRELPQNSPTPRCPIRQGVETGDHCPVG